MPDEWLHGLDWCLWCNYRPGTLRVEQTSRNYGLAGGMATARLPICESCHTAQGR